MYYLQSFYAEKEEKVTGNSHSSSIITTPVGERQADTESISLEQLQFLVHLVDQSDIVELEVTQNDTRTRLVLRKPHQSISHVPSAESSSPPEKASSHDTEPGRSTILAPCVGFFQSWSKPLVAVGDTVRGGQHVAVIRSLGIPNEVEAPMTGRIVEILVQDGQPIEYGQPLMVIEE